MSTRIIFLNLCLAMLCASQAKAQIIVSDGTKIQNDTIGEAHQKHADRFWENIQMVFVED